MINLTDRELDQIGTLQDGKEITFIQGCMAHEILSTIKQDLRRLTKALIEKVCFVACYYDMYRIRAIRVWGGSVDVFYMKNGEVQKITFPLKGKGIV